MRIVIKKENFIPIKKYNNKISVFFDVKTEPSFEEGIERISCEVKDYPISLTEEGIKEEIISSIKERFSREILNGFEYGEHFITLSEYDQTNFSRLYAMSNLSMLYPLTINIGKSEEQHTITLYNKEEFDELMLSINNFIEGKRKECRKTLSNINWDLYKLT